ncbi:Gldg family protein [Verrucomicrobiaceae bacterium 227]
MNALKPILLGLTGVGVLFFGLSFGIEGLETARWYFALLGIAALSLLPNSNIVRAAFGTAVLAVLVFFVTKFVSFTPVGTKNIDLTEDNRYTLTEGTRAILGELNEPVTINYYVTRDVNGTPADFKRYIPRVDGFLREIEGLANNGLITVNFIDPEPNTDEEDAALLDQVQQIDVTQDDKMIFGASINSLEKKTVIPFFNPDSETQLEFDVISAIAEVSTRTQPTVGLVTAHNMSVGGSSGRGWLFHQVLNRTYNVANLGMDVTSNLEDIYDDQKWGDAPDYLDPAQIPLVLVIHPAGITPAAEFALDQYLLRGGTVVACVDSYSVAAQQSAQQPQFPGMPPQGGTPTSSTLPELFKKHQIVYSDQVIIDRAYAVQNTPSVMLLNKEAMPLKDDISLASIQNLAFALSGGFSSPAGKSMGPGLDVSTLVESSYKYAFVDGQSLSSPQGAQGLRFALGNQKEEDKKQSLVTLLSGNFETAFPDGAPSQPEEDSEGDDEKTEKAEDKPDHLTTGAERGNLYLIADSDFLYDGLAYQFQRFGNSGIMQTVSGNAPFLFNIIDQAVGSKHLIGARARTPMYRNFTVLKELEAELEQKAGADIEKYRKEATAAANEINKIRSEMTQNNAAQLAPEIQAKIAEFRKTEVDANKAIREKQKSYQSQIDGLKAGIFWHTLLWMPAIVIAIGLGVFAYRRMSTNAR